MIKYVGVFWTVVVFAIVPASIGAYFCMNTAGEIQPSKTFNVEPPNPIFVDDHKEKEAAVRPVVVVPPQPKEEVPVGREYNEFRNQFKNLRNKDAE
jgi:hypothetical protein